MEQEGLARLRASFDGPVRVQRSVEMRYGEQIFEITVPLDGIDWEVDDPLPQIVERFHNRHEELYTYALREQSAVLVNARAAVIGVLPGVPQEPVRPAQADAAPRGERACGCASGPVCRCSSSTIWPRAGDRRAGYCRVGDDDGLLRPATGRR